MSDLTGIGSIVGAVLAFAQNERSLDSAENMASDNRRFQWETLAASQQWQERMRASAYQATMDDMRKAGLNPMLAFSRGATPHGGASAAPGGTVTPQQTSIAESAAAGARVGSAISLIGAQRENVESQTELNRASTIKAHAEAASAEATARNTDQRTVSEAGVPAVQHSTIALQGAQSAVASASEAQLRQTVQNIERYGAAGNYASPQAALSALEAVQRRAIALGTSTARQVGATAEALAERFRRSPLWRAIQRNEQHQLRPRDTSE